MGPERRVTQRVPKDDPLWGMLGKVESVEIPLTARAIAYVVAQSWGQPLPGALVDVLAMSDVAACHDCDWYQHLNALAEGGPLDPGLIGRCWEAMLRQPDRRSQGAHYTPAPVAAEVVRIAIDSFLSRRGGDGDASESAAVTVWDPTCGGGAFLLAALELLADRTGADRSELVEHCYATDIDGVALSLCDAALEIWSGGRARPNLRCVDALLVDDDDLEAGGWPSQFQVVVGNPPFLGQLTSDTARSGERAHRLRERYAAVSRAYLDEAGLFVAMASQRIVDGGVVGLIVPSSMLGAADAIDLRRSLTDTHTLSALWIDPVQSFDAAVDVVAVVLSRQDTPSTASPTTSVWMRSVESLVETPTPETWAPLLASVDAVPTLSLPAQHGRVGDRATLTAGFRQHYYGIANAVREANDEGQDQPPALITAGAIDPLLNNWGNRQARFARKPWQAPVLDIDQITDTSVRDWFVERCRPKLLLASQTPVVEVLADPDGGLVPSVPVLVVEPADTADLWPLAAVLSSPAASAWLYLRAAGTGLSRGAMRIRAKEVSLIPLPADRSAWERGAEFARSAHDLGARGDRAHYVAALRDLGKAMDTAYGVDDAVGQWWWKRLGRRTVGDQQAY